MSDNIADNDPIDTQQLASDPFAAFSFEEVTTGNVNTTIGYVPLTNTNLAWQPTVMYYYYDGVPFAIDGNFVKLYKYNRDEITNPCNEVQLYPPKEKEPIIL